VRKASPATPDRVEPDVHFVLGVHSGARVRMPDGVRVEFMSFHHWVDDDESDDATKIFPSPMLRVTEGQIVHTTLRPSSNTHTIHHHGIEPTSHNDGVGHASFEVEDEYTYQWRPASAGTYFYHCHKNTTLHFELGMYGPLIVDPPGGAGLVRHGTDVVPYDHEALWIADDVDPAWHLIEDHHEGLRHCPFDPSDAMLHFDPAYWLLSGIPHPFTRTHRDVAVDCGIGERVLVRVLNAAYGPVDVVLPFPGECVGVDGHALGGPHDGRYSYPYTVPAGSPIRLTTAQRYDMLLTPDRAGVFTVSFSFRDWVRSSVYGVAETTITVS
jgi:FtsP/CotA-like multicopper oxidase with cupredoxin domain